MTEVRMLTDSDRPAWQRLRRSLWPHLLEVDNERGCKEIVSDPARFAVIVSEQHGELNGFIELSLRQYAEGCDSSPVGFIEGWYVAPEFRGAGIGRRLVRAAEDWARSMRCTEMASDASLDNTLSHDVHRRLGYAEVERLVCFRKDL